MRPARSVLVATAAVTAAWPAVPPRATDTEAQAGRLLAGGNLNPAAIRVEAPDQGSHERTRGGRARSRSWRAGCARKAAALSAVALRLGCGEGPGCALPVVTGPHGPAGAPGDFGDYLQKAASRSWGLFVPPGSTLCVIAF